LIGRKKANNYELSTMNYWIVFLGGGLGALCRFLLNQWPTLNNRGLWTSTLIANIIAALIIGITSGLQTQGKFPISNNTWLFIATGFCGGLSTFSTFGLEIFLWMQQDKWLLVLGYITMNVVLCTALIALAHGLIETT